METEVEPYVYVLSVELRTTDGAEYENDWAIFRCDPDDVFQAFFEDGAWWIQICPGDPSDGPFETVDDVVDFLNEP